MTRHKAQPVAVAALRLDSNPAASPAYTVQDAHETRTSVSWRASDARLVRRVDG